MKILRMIGNFCRIALLVVLLGTITGVVGYSIWALYHFMGYWVFVSGMVLVLLALGSRLDDGREDEEDEAEEEEESYE